MPVSYTHLDVYKRQVQEPFAAWKKVVAAMEAKDQLLFVYLRNSNAFYDGKRVLIDGSDLFLEYMRKNDYSADLIKKTIAEVTGTRYAIGPYKRKRQEEEADVYKRQPMKRSSR